MITEIALFNNDPIELSRGCHLHIIDIETISPELGELINDKIRVITEGNTTTDILLIKQRLINYLDGKKGSTLEMGAVAEFMIHLYLNARGFKQEFIYFNLEERSIKKGFDGYYTLNTEEWILESKSGSISTNNISHDSKIIEAYNDLTNKISDEDGNNPWRNAYNHACHIDVGSASDIIKNLKKLTDDFERKKYQNVANLNIMPASTIFLNGVWETLDFDVIRERLQVSFSSKSFKQLNILCLTKKTLSMLEDFLKQ